MTGAFLLYAPSYTLMHGDGRVRSRLATDAQFVIAPCFAFSGGAGSSANGVCTSKSGFIKRRRRRHTVGCKSRSICLRLWDVPHPVGDATFSPPPNSAAGRPQTPR